MRIYENKLHVVHGFETLIDGDMTPTQNHQLQEEILLQQRDFGAMLRFQRDMEGRYP